MIPGAGFFVFGERLARRPVRYFGGSATSAVRIQ
jgi:hypothetical protein